MANRIMNKLRPLLRRIEPAAKVIESATSVLGQLKEPTVFGVANAVAGGLKTLGEVVSDNDDSRSYHFETMVSVATLCEAARSAGADVVEEHDGKKTLARAYFDNQSLLFDGEGDVWFANHPSRGAGEWLRKALDRVLGPVLHVFVSDAEYRTAEFQLTPIQTTTADRIWASTRGMVGDGRVILLNKKPGTGKTTVAQAIARDCDLGRILVIDPSVVKSNNHAAYFSPFMLGLMSAGVIILDDIDKIDFELPTLELLRSKCRLLILTANNGQYDSVLDAALMRPARIDEVFTIAPEPREEQRPPFDRLTPDQWAKVREWPIAYMNEVERRILVRPDDLRLDDLEQRLGRKTRSKGGELR